MGKYIKILQQNTRSLFLTKNKAPDGRPIDRARKLLRENRTAIIPIDPTVSDLRDVTDSVKLFFGDPFYSKSIFRYYFPKKLVYVPTLFPKPRKIYRSDENLTRSRVKAELPKFRGVAKNKVLDLRNTVFDFSALIREAVITDKRWMKRPMVMAYSQQIMPEIMSYIMFSDVNTGPVNELNEVNDEAVETLKVRHFNNLKPEPIEDDMMSSESYDLNLLSKTKSFGMSGEVSGIDKYGFQNFIVLWKFTSTYQRIGKREIINGTLPIRAMETRDPNIIYDMAFIRFIYKLYVAYYTGERSDDEFINEFVKHRVVFYIYVDKGISFTFDCHELKELMNWSPRRVLARLSQIITLMISCNRQTATDKDVDDMIAEHEEDEKSQDQTPEIGDMEEVEKKKLNLNIKEIISQYASFNKLKEFLSEKARVKPLIEDSMSNMILPSKMSNFNAVQDGKININIDRIINQLSAADEDDETDIVDDDVDQEQIDQDFGDDESDNEPITEEVPEEETVEEIETSVIDDKFISSDIELSKKQQKMVMAAKEKFKHIKIYDNVSVQELLEKEVPEINGDYNKYKTTVKTRDKTLVQSSMLRDFTMTYVHEKLDYDIINAVKSLEYNGAGVHFYITDIKIEDTSNQFNRQRTYRFKLKDTNGKESNLVFDIPYPDENGFLFMNGNKYLFKKQNFPIPILKIAPDTVMFTTHHPYKAFIKRHRNGFNRNSILLKRILLQFVTKDNKSISVARGTVKSGNDDYLTNFEYDDIATDIYSVVVRNRKNNVKIYMSQADIRNDIVKYNLHRDAKWSLSINPETALIPSNEKIMNDVNILPYAIDFTGKIIHAIKLDSDESVTTGILNLVINNIEDQDGVKEFIRKFTLPKQRMYSEITVMNRSCPLIVFLASLYGLTRVLKTAKVDWTFSEKKPADKMNSLWIRFADGYLSYNQYPVENALLLNGLNYIKPETIRFKDMDSPSVYVEYLGNKFGSRNVYKGWLNMEQFFIDPVTLKILSMYGLPHTFLEAFIYTNYLLSDNSYKKESSVQCYRLRQYEIFAEQLYQELIINRINYQQKKGKTNTLSIKRNFMGSRLRATNLLQNFDDSSPLMEAKSVSIVSMKGPGGTNLEQAFKLDKRSFGEDAAGIYTFANTDSGTVGTLKQLSLSPSVESTLGFYKPVDKSKVNDLSFANLNSPEESLIPFVTKIDDPKRIIFTAAQSTHVIPMNNELPIIRTGSEKTIQNVIGDTYCFKAKKDGVITEIDEVNNKVLVTYKDGTKDYVDCNPKLNKISNFFLENKLSPVVKKGQNVLAQQPIAVNTNFFKVENGQTVFTQGIMARVAVFESYGNDEDGALMSQSTSRRMYTALEKRKQVTMKVSSTVFSMKSVGDHVNASDYLMSFDESGSADVLDDTTLGGVLGGLDDETLASLRNSPKAGYTGEITDIRIYWTVPPEKMSKSCAKIVNDYIKKIKKECEAEEKFTGRPSANRYKMEITVPKNNLINGARVDKDGSIVIEYFIKHTSYMSSADKVSFYSSLKSTITSIIPEEQEPYTESGKKIDFIMSGLAIFRRMVNSVWVAGFIGKIFDDVGTNIAEEFFNDLK